MVNTWSQFLDFFTIGLGCGFTIGFIALGVRRIRITTYNSFKSAMNL